MCQAQDFVKLALNIYISLMRKWRLSEGERFTYGHHLVSGGALPESQVSVPPKELLSRKEEWVISPGLSHQDPLTVQKPREGFTRVSGLFN